MYRKDRFYAFLACSIVATAAVATPATNQHQLLARTDNFPSRSSYFDFSDASGGNIMVDILKTVSSNVIHAIPVGTIPDDLKSGTVKLTATMPIAPPPSAELATEIMQRRGTTDDDQQETSDAVYSDEAGHLEVRQARSPRSHRSGHKGGHGKSGQPTRMRKIR